MPLPAVRRNSAAWSGDLITYRTIRATATQAMIFLRFATIACLLRPSAGGWEKRPHLVPGGSRAAVVSPTSSPAGDAGVRPVPRAPVATRGRRRWGAVGSARHVRDRAVEDVETEIELGVAHRERRRDAEDAAHRR